MSKSIDKMAEQFTSPEELKAYSEAQYKTILSLNEKLSIAQKEIEQLKAANTKLSQESVIKSTVPDGSQFKVTDEETACVIQIALLKANALERELTMDETKRLEIFVKTLQIIRNKVETKKPEKDTSKMSTEELMAFMNDTPTVKDQ